jgi:WD40 repeat protein
MKLNATPRPVPLTNTSAVSRLALSDDGADVIAGQYADPGRPALSRWSVPSGEPLGDIDGWPPPDQQETCGALDRAGDLVAVAGVSWQRLTVLDLASGQRNEPVETGVVWARFGDGLLAVGGPEALILDLAGGEVRWRQDPPAPEEFSHTGLRPLVALHPDGSRFAVGGSGETDVRLHSLAEPDGEAVILPGAPARLRWLGFSPGGTYLGALDAYTKSTAIWDVEAGAPHLPEIFGENLSDNTSIAFHPDGEHFAVAMFSGTIKIHRLSDGARTDRKARSHNGEVPALVFTPDGRHLLSGGDDGKLLVWAVE